MRNRRGVSLLELLIATSLLITTMTISGRFVAASQRIWQQTRHARLALEELTNRIDLLRTVPRDALAEELRQLTPSSWIAEILADPALEGETITDELGARIRHTLRWNTGTETTSRQLIAWLDGTNRQDPSTSEVIR